MSITADQFIAEVRNVEGVNITVVAPPGSSFEHYPYERCVKGNMSVSDFKKKRLVPSAGGHSVEVFDGEGNIVHGRTRADTLRNSYYKHVI